MKTSIAIAATPSGATVSATDLTSMFDALDRTFRSNGFLYFKTQCGEVPHVICVSKEYQNRTAAIRDMDHGEKLDWERHLKSHTPEITPDQLQSIKDEIAALIPPCDSYFILGTNTFGHRLHWNGEKFTDQGSPWHYQSIADAEMDTIDHDGMENIGIYGSPEESGPSVFIKPITP